MTRLVCVRPRLGAQGVCLASAAVRRPLLRTSGLSSPERSPVGYSGKGAGMFDCKYCGKPAGLFHSAHKECEAAHASGVARITSAIDKALVADGATDSLPALVDQAAAQSFIGPAERRAMLVAGWTRALDGFLGHGVLDDSQQARLAHFMEKFGLSKEDLNQSHAFERMVKGITLREVMHGEIPKHFTLTGNLPVNLQKSEQVVWAFPNTEYLEDRTHREYVGRSAGVSVRIVKGVYYHTSGFQGYPVDKTVRQLVDTGLFVVTDKNIYFVGPRKSLRVPYSKIVSFQPFSDGMGLSRDAASAKPQVFVTHDGWFTYNLVTNLAKL